MIYDDIAEKINNFIRSGNLEGLVSFLENLGELEPDLCGELSILLGLVLLMPPFVDYEASMKSFKKAYGTQFQNVAAVWNGYLFVTLYPVDESFLNYLDLKTAEGLYILALYKSFKGDPDWKRCIRESIAKGRFPKNIRLYLRQIPKPSNFKELANEARNLVIDRAIESTESPRSYDDLLISRWNELIKGTSLTSENWKCMVQELS